jgi:tetratricopeptide (TPR) repeat protein
LDFSEHIQKAEEAARRRNYDFAVELYQQLVELDADHADARAGLRRVLKKRAEQKQGSKLLRALGGAGPLAMAKTLRKAGRHEASAKALESYLASNPLDEEANLLLGMALEDAGHFNAARVVYEFVAEIAPRNGEGLRRAGAMMHKKGEHAKALEYYERALEADPRDQEALKARKNLAAETALERTSAAGIEHSRQQIRDKAEAHALERSQRLHLTPEELRAELERLEARYADEPSNVDLMLEMADLQEKLKEPDAALDLVQRALSYRKQSADLLARAADLKLKVLKRAVARASREGDEARANELERELHAAEVESYRERVRVHPGDAELRLQLGKRLLRAGELDAAAAELQRAVNDPRVRREAHFHLADCFKSKGFLDLARKEYERALEGQSLDERGKEILYNLGAIAEAEGDAAQARASYARIFEADIGYRDVAAKMERFK